MDYSKELHRIREKLKALMKNQNFDFDITLSECDLITYERDLRILAKNRNLNTYPFNRNKKKAEIVFVVFFETANESMHIYTDGFTKEISDRERFLSTLESFIESGKKLYVVYDNEPKDNSKAFKLIDDASKKPNTNVFHKKVDDEFLKNVEKCDELLRGEYFAVGDNHMFRHEFYLKEHIARISFNNPDVCNKFLRVFDGQFSS